MLHALEHALGIAVAYPGGPRDLLAVGFLCGLGLLIFLIGALIGPSLLGNKGKPQAAPGGGMGNPAEGHSMERYLKQKAGEDQQA